MKRREQKKWNWLKGDESEKVIANNIISEKRMNKIAIKERVSYMSIFVNNFPLFKTVVS